MTSRSLNRIMIVGQPGSGKSTLAQALGERTGLPVIHIDRIHWQPGWVERSKAEKTRLCREAEQGGRWIFEGGHSATWPSRLARADMLIWLDRPVRDRKVYSDRGGSSIREWRMASSDPLRTFVQALRAHLPFSFAEHLSPPSVGSWRP